MVVSNGYHTFAIRFLVILSCYQNNKTFPCLNRKSFRQKYFRNNFVIHTYSFTFAVPKSLCGEFGCHCKPT